jgi:hypothetical protein
MATPALPSDATLVRYLLGALPSDEEQRLDELSITDADFAERLRAIEHDLADAYARGELRGQERERWEQRYLASPEGRLQLRVAQALAAHDARAARVARPRQSRTFTWGLAAAAVIVLAASTAYFATHRPTPRQTNTSTAVRPTPSVAPQPAQAPHPAAEPRFVAFTLVPPTRSIAETPTLKIPTDVDEVRLTLKLEPNDAEHYTVAVRPAAATKALWDSGVVDSTTTGDEAAIVLTMPAGIFRVKPEATTTLYLVNVNAISRRGTEIVGSYPLRVRLEPR